MFAAQISRSRLSTLIPSQSRAISSSAARGSQRKAVTSTRGNNYNKTLYSRAAAGFAAGLTIALYSGWAARSGGVVNVWPASYHGKPPSANKMSICSTDMKPQTVHCESSVDDLIVNRKNNGGETTRRRNKTVNDAEDAHDPTRPKEWDDENVRVISNFHNGHTD